MAFFFARFLEISQAYLLGLAMAAFCTSLINVITLHSDTPQSLTALLISRFGTFAILIVFGSFWFLYYGLMAFPAALGLQALLDATHIKSPWAYLLIGLVATAATVTITRFYHPDWPISYLLITPPLVVTFFMWYLLAYKTT